MPQSHPVDTSEPLVGPTLSCFRVPAAAGTLRLMLVGTLDLVTADLAREAVRRAQADSRVVICDLGDVWFVDLSGLRVLLDAATAASLTGGRFAVASCPSSVPRMLALLMLEGALEIQASRSSAPQDGRCAEVRRHVG